MRERLLFPFSLLFSSAFICTMFAKSFNFVRHIGLERVSEIPQTPLEGGQGLSG